MPKLGVNVDHVATVRQARRGPLPSPVWAAVVAEEAGADSIVCHLREDRRHIQDADLPAFKKSIQIPLNLEMAANPEIVQIACRIKPDQATIVPERRQELTTEGGLDLHKNKAALERAVGRLRDAGIRVSLFIDPVQEQVEAACALEVPMVEFHTGKYAEAKGKTHIDSAFAHLKQAAKLARKEGLTVAAGHGLDYENVRPVAMLPELEELNIGFSVVARSIEVGFYEAVKEMAKLVHGARA